MDRERIATATFEEIWAGVVDPLYVEAASSPASPPARPEPVLDVLALWVLHSVAARSGLGSFVTEEPPWVAVRVGGAARRLGLTDIADHWEAAVRGLDLARLTGRVPARVRFADRAAVETLQSLLVTGEHAELNTWLVEKVRQNAELFAS